MQGLCNIIEIFTDTKNARYRKNTEIKNIDIYRVTVTLFHLADRFNRSRAKGQIIFLIVQNTCKRFFL